MDFPQGDISSGWSFIRVVSHQWWSESEWTLLGVIFHQGSQSVDSPHGHFSSGWSFIRVVVYKGGLSSGCFSSRVVRVDSPQGDISSGWSFIWVVSHQWWSESEWILLRVIFHQGDLSSG